MNWYYKIFEPSTPGNLKDEVNMCLIQFRDFLKNLYPTNILVRLNIYVDGDTNLAFLEFKNQLSSQIQDTFDADFIFEIIPQKPTRGKVEMKAMYFDNTPSSYEKSFTREDNIQCIQLKNSEELIVLTSSASFSGKTLADSENCFIATENSLKKFDLDFSNTIRQWNYIGEIIKETQKENTCSQNYQIFNDVRSLYYSKVDFTDGYPAATGIGIDFPGIILQTITVKYFNNNKIFKLDNPLQKPAHQYSEKVLIGTPVQETKTTPKFERAKMIITENNGWVFVSGTAAIKGELHDDSHGIKIQTSETLQLIKELVSIENLQNNNSGVIIKNIIPKTFRAYVKHKKDIPLVMSECIRFFGDIAGVVLVADVCRDALLVEIECEYKLIK